MTVKINDYNVMTDGKNIFDEPVKYDIRTYENNWKIVIGQGDVYTNAYLLDYVYYKVIAIDLSKQQALDDESKAIQQINFIGNLDWAAENNVFHYWRSKRNHFKFFKRIC